MGISITNRQRKARINLARLRRRAAAVLDKIRPPGDSSIARDIDIAIVGDRTMRKLNRQFRNIDETTDVLSFPSGPSPAEGFSGQGPDDFNSAQERKHIGDVAISIGEALRQAGEDGVSIDVAIDRLIVHGVLHLHGFDHDSAEGSSRMRRKENALLKMLHGAGLPGYAVRGGEDRG